MSVIFVANKLVVSLFGFLMILKASMADLSGFLVLYPPPPLRTDQWSSSQDLSVQEEGAVEEEHGR